MGDVNSNVNMAALLDSYEQQYGIISASITAKTAKLSGTSLGEDRRIVIQQIVKELEEARDILEQMELEIRDLNSSGRSRYQTRIQSHSAELSRLENEFKKNKMQYAKQREELLGESLTPDDTDDQSRQLIDNTERLERGNRRLEAGYKIAIETEELGNSILTDLNHQRETMQKSRSRLRETDEELGRSGRVLNRMIVRIIQNRLIILGLVLLILVVVIIGVYFASRK